jgi:hypothetical protein
VLSRRIMALTFGATSRWRSDVFHHLISAQECRVSAVILPRPPDNPNPPLTDRLYNYTRIGAGCNPRLSTRLHCHSYLSVLTKNLETPRLPPAHHRDTNQRTPPTHKPPNRSKPGPINRFITLCMHKPNNEDHWPQAAQPTNRIDSQRCPHSMTQGEINALPTIQLSEGTVA